jgi:two-component system, NtrC family, sensor histidine kinase KinB
MTLNKKLNWGLGFLFAVIFGLVIFCSFYVQTIAADSNNILKNNYVSVVYAKNMAVSLDAIRSSVLAKALDRTPDWGIFERAKAEFERNYALELKNITETNEKDYVESLGTEYGAFLRAVNRLVPGPAGESLYFTQLAPTYDSIRKSIDNIFDVNMQAILRKNKLAGESAVSMSHYMAGIGTLLFILALAYFWYFPLYVSNSLAYLADKMRELVGDAGLESRSKSDDELMVIMNSIDLLRAKWHLTGRSKIPPINT